MWKCKGDAGSRFCMACLTLSPKAIEGWGYRDALLAASPVRDDQVTFCTDEMAIDSVARLEAYKAVDAPRDFEQRQQVLGFTWSPYSLLSDRRLCGVIKPCSQLMHDWMHGLFSNGVFNILLQLTLNALENAGLPGLYRMLAEYVLQWNMPKRIGERQLVKKKHSTNNDVRAIRKVIRSERKHQMGLSLYPLLTFWLESMILPTGVADRQCMAFAAFADFG